MSVSLSVVFNRADDRDETFANINGSKNYLVKKKRITHRGDAIGGNGGMSL